VALLAATLKKALDRLLDKRRAGSNPTEDTCWRRADRRKILR
jgi:hypothetical protein